MKQQPKIVTMIDDADAQTERLLYEHYCRTGKVIPQTPEDVARAEAEDAKSKVELPARLRNPQLFGAAPCEPSSKPLRFPAHSTAPIAQNLARAAREGGTIPAEVEARMELDRAKAELDADKDDGHSE
jgi:hypothetical protein